MIVKSFSKTTSGNPPHSKYSSKSFTWGLFMYPAVVGEFRAQYKGDSVYLKTTSNLKNNEVFQKDVEDTKKWIVDVLKKAKAKKR